MQSLKNLFIALLFIGYLMTGCGSSTDSKKQDDTKDTSLGKADLPWLKNAVIYEVNLRQYSASGKFKDFATHLDSLKSLGVDILWFMPLQPIGEKNRKGTLGSYYSIRDYRAINPEFGTLDEFKDLVETCHTKGFKVILDWVGNHSSWDNALITEHPDWYTHDSTGKIVPPVPDWSDVADLNYDNMDLRAYMIESMKWWISECDLDGFRCDVAMMVPTDFWEDATRELNTLKPVFMLAEAEQPDHMAKAFHACYGWEFHHLMKEAHKGTKNGDSLMQYFERDAKRFPKGTIKMNFVANHDENTWNGTAGELFDKAEDAMTALTFTAQGLPLIYNGMEAGLDKRLKFFDKDPIDWNKPNAKARFEFYKTLASIRHKNPALWINVDGQTFTRLYADNPDVYAFIRQSGTNRVLTIVNLTGKTVKLDSQVVPSMEQYTLRLYSDLVTDGIHLYQLGPYGYSVSTWNEPE